MSRINKFKKAFSCNLSQLPSSLTHLFITNDIKNEMKGNWVRRSQLCLPIVNTITLDDSFDITILDRLIGCTPSLRKLILSYGTDDNNKDLNCYCTRIVKINAFIQYNNIDEVIMYNIPKYNEDNPSLNEKYQNTTLCSNIKSLINGENIKLNKLVINNCKINYLNNLMQNVTTFKAIQIDENVILNRI